MFEKFIKTCLDYYGLHPCHYFSAPGLGWDAMLKMTGVELKIISHINMHLFIEKGMRCDISYIAKSHSKIEDCDSNKKKEIHHILGCKQFIWLGYESAITI